MPAAATPATLKQLKVSAKKHVSLIVSLSNQRDPRGSVGMDVLPLPRAISQMWSARPSSAIAGGQQSDMGFRDFS